MNENIAANEVVAAKQPEEFDLGDFTLQLMKADDSEEAYRIHELNRDFWATYLDYASDYTAQKAHNDFTKARSLYAAGKLFSYWIIKDGEKVGDVGMTILDDNKAELGYKLIETAQGQGLATRAAERLKHYGFEELNLRAIDLLIKPFNKSSQRVAMRLGAKIVNQVEKEFNGKKSVYDVWEVTNA